METAWQRPTMTKMGKTVAVLSDDEVASCSDALKHMLRSKEWDLENDKQREQFDFAWSLVKRLDAHTDRQSVRTMEVSPLITRA